MPKLLNPTRDYPRENCADCGHVTPVDRRKDGASYCAKCARVNPIFFRECPRCRSRAYLSKGLCISCRAEESVRSLFTDELVESDSRIRSMRDECLAGDPIAVQAVFNRLNFITKLEAALTSPAGPPSHEDLDAAGPDVATRTVRAFLVQYGMLPARDDHLARLEQWIVETSQSIPNLEDRHLVIGFTRWAHLRRLRQQSSPTRFGQVSSSRREIRLIVRLLAWSRGRGQSLSTLTQGDLDLWAATSPPDFHRVRNFLIWAAANGGCRTMTLPKRPAALPLATSGDDTAHWAALSRVFNPSTQVPPATRLAAALVLLYGISIHKLVELTVDDVTQGGGILYVHLGRVPLALPDQVGQFASETKANRHAGVVFHASYETHWLFPGNTAGNHISVASLRERLYAIDIKPRSARSHALTSLAQQLPGVVLSRLTGLHITTAQHWIEAVSASQAKYATLSEHLALHTEVPRATTFDFTLRE